MSAVTGLFAGNSLGSSSSPPPHDRVKRDISPKSVDQGPATGYGEAAPQNRQIAYSGALRSAPARRRLPQVPMRGRPGGPGQGQGGPPVRGRGGQMFSMERGYRRQTHGRPQPGYSGNSGYSDTEMLGEQLEDSWAAERHRQRLDRLRLERDGGHTATLTPSTLTQGHLMETQSLASEPPFSRGGQFSDQQSYGGWSWKYGLTDGGWDRGGGGAGGGHMSDTQSVCGYTSDTGYRPSDRNYPPPPVHATNTSIRCSWGGWDQNLFDHNDPCFRRDVEGWSRPGTYTRDMERDRTDYYSRERRQQYGDTDMDSIVSGSALNTKKPPYSGTSLHFDFVVIEEFEDTSNICDCRGKHSPVQWEELHR